jgi:cytochrome d ubiquinol oxidase subunit I
MDAVLLARIQFAFTVGYHFLFVPISLGTGVFMLLAGRRWYKTQSENDKAGFLFWLKLFSLTFVIGVATGITMEFAFGTNWATYSRFVGDIFGAPLAAEALFAFFLESTFLGVLLFGRNRVPRKLYYVSMWLVVCGALLSALWIIIANSWQQTPAGYAVQDGHAVLTGFWAAAFNPSTVPRYLHTVFSTFVAGSFMAALIAGFYMKRGRHTEFAKRTLKVAVIFGLICSIAMPIIGDWQARVVGKYQPVKMAAYEGLFQSEKNAGLLIFGVMDTKDKTIHAKLALPGLLSWTLTGSTSGEVPGLETVPPEEQPPLQLTFTTYRIMMILGIYFGLVLLYGLYLLVRKKLYSSRRYLTVLMWSAPLTWVAIEAGWFATEVGRQPWIVQGMLKTKDAASSVVSASHILTTMIIFVVIYALLFGVWFTKMRKAIVAGPQDGALDAGGYSAVPAAAPSGGTGDRAAKAQGVKK